MHETTCLHGTLIVVNGQGLLITGPPKSGKSTLAYRLLQRGHQLVSDDAVDVIPKNKDLIGYPPPLIKGQLWLNTKGLMDITTVFSPKAIVDSHRIDRHIDLVYNAPTHYRHSLSTLDHHLRSLKHHSPFPPTVEYIEKITQTSDEALQR